MYFDFSNSIKIFKNNTTPKTPPFVRRTESSSYLSVKKTLSIYCEIKKYSVSLNYHLYNEQFKRK